MYTCSVHSLASRLCYISSGKMREKGLDSLGPIQTLLAGKWVEGFSEKPPHEVPLALEYCCQC